MKTEPSDLRRWLVALVKLAIFGLVAAGIVHTVWKSLHKFAEMQFSLADINWLWLFVCCAAYLLAMAPAAFYWHRVLLGMNQHPTLLESFRAFYVSQLGKYVPGKAMVVVIRSALVRGPRVDGVVAAVSVFVETLTMMAVGAMVAAAILAALFREQTQLMFFAVICAVGAGVPTLPPLFRRVVCLLGVAKASPRVDHALEGITYRLMLEGWLIDAVGWCIMGLSLWAALRAMPGMAERLADPWTLPLLVACVALANVAGFVSMLPGGIGVREWVIITLVGAHFGEVAGIVSAVILRLASLLAELGFCGILYAAAPRRVEQVSNLP